MYFLAHLFANRSKRKTFRYLRYRWLRVRRSLRDINLYDRSLRKYHHQSSERLDSSASNCACNRARHLHLDPSLRTDFTPRTLCSFVLSLGISRWRYSQTSELVEEQKTRREGRIASRRSVMSSLIRDSCLLPLSSFEPRGLPFCLANIALLSFLCGSSLLVRYNGYSTAIDRLCPIVYLPIVPLCSFIPRSVTR